MSQKKVDAYKQNKKNRENESRKAVRTRRLEIGILLAVIAVGLIWFIVAGISNSAGKSSTISIETEAIDNYTNSLQAGTEEETEAAEPEEAEAEEEGAED